MRLSHAFVGLLLAAFLFQCSAKGLDESKKSSKVKKSAEEEEVEEQEEDDDDNKVLIYSISKKVYFFSGHKEPMFEIQVARLSTVDHSRRKHGDDEEDKEEPPEDIKKKVEDKEKGKKVKKEAKSKRKKKDSGEEEDVNSGKAKVSIDEASVKDICKILEQINPLLVSISPLDFLPCGNAHYKHKT